MAIAAELYRDGWLVEFSPFPDQRRERIADDPPEVADDDELRTLVWWYWDAEKLERGEREFLGIEVLDISALGDHELALIERVELPRIDCAQAGLYNVTIPDALRWARDTYGAAGRAVSLKTSGG